MNKKLFFFITCILPTYAFSASYKCQVQDLGAMRIKNSNEYIYPTKADFDDKRALVCGHQGGSGCDHNVKIILRQNHYWGTSSKNLGAIYRCNANGANAWESRDASSLHDCDDVSKLTYITARGGYKIYATSCTATYCVGVCRHKGSATSSAGCAKGTMPGINNQDFYPVDTDSDAYTCADYNIGTDPNKDQCKSKCYKEGDKYLWHSRIVTCKNNLVPDTSGTKCVEKSSGSSSSGGGSGNSSSSSTKTNTKKEKKSNDYGGRTSTMGIACYKNGSFTKYDKVTDECKCINPNYEFKITDKYNAEGSCFPRPGTVPVSPATATAGGKSAAPALTELEIKKKDCDSLFRSGLNVEWSANDQKCVCTDSNKYLTPSNTCEYTPAYLAGQDAERKESRVKIIAAGKVLNGIAETFDVSVWKNSDGGFNTARLASDGIAGVTLGTIGGLITSNIIKKNQVKSGFEDMKCAIGGQVVADWGDEFDVGIR